ncbi:MAG: 4-hydroxy-tetrahydrodipicolinate synthase [Gammaproteobacteria bacterium]|nr:4-hydroxy-tetrahydrodipicolinate synthase [Gammaproteobacteria bacterium]MDX2486735.1 4-hydroxy-tetrahydrodipicolinate synthase [Gammaproteobacteria bacterium]
MISGSIVALVTPMDVHGNVDQAALQRLVEFHIDNKTDAIVAVGTTGESATLDVDEHCDVVGQVVELVNGRIPVIAGTGANATREAITLTAKSAELGVDACLLVTPYYNKPGQEGLYQHYKAIADAVDIPQILYNVPGRTACDMTDETSLRLAEIPNIIGLKDATGDLERAAWLIKHKPAGFALYSGDDASAMEFVLAGGDGVISVTANVAPAAMHEMVMAARSGNRQQADTVNQSLIGLHKDLFVEANPIPVKWAVQQMGLAGPGIRLPLTPLASENHQIVRDAMDKAGAL